MFLNCWCFFRRHIYIYNRLYLGVKLIQYIEHKDNGGIFSSFMVEEKCRGSITGVSFGIQMSCLGASETQLYTAKVGWEKYVGPVPYTSQFHQVARQSRRISYFQMLLVASIESLAEDILGSANSTKGGVALVRVQWDVQDQKCLLGPLEVYFLRKHSRFIGRTNNDPLCSLRAGGPWIDFS